MAATLVWASEAGCAGVGGLGRCGGEQGTGGDAVHPRPLLLRHVLADLRVGMSTHHAGRAAPMLIAVGSERLDLLYSFAARPATTITDTNVAQRATARCGNSRYTQVLPGRRPLERAAGRDNSRDSATAWHHRPGSSAARIRARGRRTKRANTPRRHHARPEQACQRLLHPPCRRPPGKTPAHCYWILTLDRFCAFAESRHRHSTYEHDNYPSSRQNDKGSIVRIQDNTWRLAANCFSANSSFVGRTARVVCNMVTRSAAARPGADSSHNGAHGDHQPYRRRRQATTEAASKPRVAGSGKIVTVASPSPPVTR